MPDIVARVRQALAAAGPAVDDDIAEELGAHALALYEAARADGCDHDEAERRVDALIATWSADADRLRRRPRRDAVVAAPPGDTAIWTGLANDIRYGLTGYVWTNDVGRALRVADALEAGMIWLNSENVRHLPTPFGGMKSSGIGRDGGDYSFDFYMETKHVSLARGTHKIQKLGI